MERTRGARGGVVIFPGLRLDVPGGTRTPLLLLVLPPPTNRLCCDGFVRARRVYFPLF